MEILNSLEWFGIIVVADECTFVPSAAVSLSESEGVGDPSICLLAILPSSFFFCATHGATHYSKTSEALLPKAKCFLETRLAYETFLWYNFSVLRVRLM